MAELTAERERRASAAPNAGGIWTHRRVIVRMTGPLRPTFAGSWVGASGVIASLLHATTFRSSLDRAEVATTAAAIVASTGLYVRHGHNYLARGVVGDLVGLAVLAVPLVLVRRRGRHEAMTCLAAIGLVHLADPDWPLERSDSFWWGAISVGLAAYLLLRRRRLITLR